MIALCEHHHRVADAGAFTTAQLRDLKQSSSEPRAIRGAFDWRREQLVVHGGGITAFGCPVLLRLRGADVIWLSDDDDGNQLLNLDIWARDGSLLFSMRDNDWIVLAEFDDLQCPPAGKSLALSAPSAGVALDVRFSTLTRDELRNRLLEDGLAGARESAQRDAEMIEELTQSGAPPDYIAFFTGRRPKPEDQASEHADRVMEGVAGLTDAEEFALCDLVGEFVYPLPVRLTDSAMMLPGNSSISRATVLGGQVAVHIG
jgi:hypothetical protein